MYKYFMLSNKSDIYFKSVIVLLIIIFQNNTVKGVCCYLDRKFLLPEMVLQDPRLSFRFVIFLYNASVFYVNVVTFLRLDFDTELACVRVRAVL